MATTTLTQRVCAWFERVSAASKPPASVVAYNVGLFETKKGYSAYLIGAERYDEQNGDWACRESFTPAERYLPLPRKGFVNWQEVRAAMVAAIREFLVSPARRPRVVLEPCRGIHLGFDDGELERVA